MERQREREGRGGRAGGMEAGREEGMEGKGRENNARGRRGGMDEGDVRR